MADARINALTEDTALVDTDWLVAEVGDSEARKVSVATLRATLGYFDAIVRKSANEDVTASVALQNDNELLFPVVANVNYYYELMVSITSTSSAADFKCDFALSAGSVLNAWKQFMGLGPTTQVSQAGQHADITTAILWATGTATTNAPANRIVGMIRGDTNATFNFRWAQNTSDPAAVTVLAGSTLAYRALD